jgi:hypothetical protein
MEYCNPVHYLGFPLQTWRRLEKGLSSGWTRLLEILLLLKAESALRIVCQGRSAADDTERAHARLRLGTWDQSRQLPRMDVKMQCSRRKSRSLYTLTMSIHTV